MLTAEGRGALARLTAEKMIVQSSIPMNFNKNARKAKENGVISLPTHRNTLRGQSLVGERYLTGLECGRIVVRYDVLCLLWWCRKDAEASFSVL